MAKPLPSEDFRAVRIVLEPGDFALGAENPDPPPGDLVPEKTWQHLVGLPDDVAIRTSNDFGSILKEISEFESEFVCVSLALQDLVKQSGRKVGESPVCHALLVTNEDLAASIYNALVGYYRVAFSALRNALENVVIGLHLELSNDRALFQAWLAANEELKFGWAADNVTQNKNVSELETHLIAVTTDNFFRQKTVNRPGGFSRRLFSRLSAFTHGGPGYTHGDLWESNGPVFVRAAFIDWAIAFIQVYAFCLVACRLGHPGLNDLGRWSGLKPKGLFVQAVGRLRTQDDGAKLFQNLPASFW